MHTPTEGTRRVAGLMGALAVASLAMGFALAEVSDDDTARNAADGWPDAGVPYVDQDGEHVLVRFGQGTLRLNPEGGLRKPSFAATRTSAVVAMERARSRISLTAVADSGQKQVLSQRIIGIPIADPAGDIVVWAEPVAGRRPSGARFVAYDTAPDLQL